MSLGHFVLAASHPSVVLEGYPVGANGDRAFCSGCRRELREGHRATVLAFRFEETNQWDVPVVHCDVCAPARIAEPTPGAVEILAAAELVVGGKTERLHLAQVDVLGYSGPDNQSV